MISLPDWLEVLSLPMPATLGEVHVYLVRGPDGVGLIDTGMDDVHSLGEIDRQLASRGLSTRDIDTVVCTHHHPDHCGIGGSLQGAGARVLMSKDDSRALHLFFEHPEVDERRATFYGCHEIPEQFEARVAAMFPFFRSLQQSFVPDMLVAHGDEVDLGGVALEVVHTPGHTSGHICLLHRDSGVMFTGDHIIAGDATHVSMREEAQGSDPLGRFVESLRMIRDMGPLVGLGGHGEPVKDLSVRADQLVRHHMKRIDRVAEVLTDQPRTAYDISIEALGPRNKVFARWLAMSQTLGYLEHLVDRGRAVEVQLPGTLAFKVAG